jgi:hypothetical protein
MESSIQTLPLRKTFQQIFDDVEGEFYLPYNRHRHLNLQDIKEDLYINTCILAQLTLEIRLDRSGSRTTGYGDMGMHQNTPFLMQEQLGRILQGIAESIVQYNPMFFDQRASELYTLLLHSIPFEIYHNPKNTNPTTATLFERILVLQHSIFTTYELITHYFKDGLVTWNVFAPIVGDVSYTPIHRIQRYVPFLKKYQMEHKIEAQLEDDDFESFGGEVIIRQIMKTLEAKK